MDEKFCKVLEKVNKMVFAGWMEGNNNAEAIYEEMHKYFFPIIKEELNAGKAPATKKKTTKAKTPAVLNPLEVLRKGENLEEQLMKLDVAQLKDIIRDYDLDPLKQSTGWRKKERLVGHILEVANRRVNDSKAFSTV